MKPLEKGVDAIVSVNHDHPAIKEHIMNNIDTNVNNSKTKKDDALSLKDLYRVTAAVAPLFSIIK